MSIAIHYTSILPPDGTGREVFGLQVAIADWLGAYMRYGRSEKFTFLIGEKREEQELREIAGRAGVDAGRLVMLDRRFPERNLAGITTVFRPEPDTRRLLWQRQLGGSFAFCGLAHAISGIEAGEVLQDYCLSPSEASDAIICPSQAVKSAIRAFWDYYGDYLAARFGAAYHCPVQLPVIPLGVDIEKFSAKVTPAKRAAQRAALGIGDNDIVVLWVGRLSAAIKAHPLAMFEAAERAAQKTGAKVHLVMVGYFVPDEAKGQFKKLAADICAKAEVTFVAANDVRFPDGLWAAGDVFLSLVDNHQESFGLTPIEAMAAGLPRVVSDWDGYRDSVTDGEDGFLIRTTQPPPGCGFDLTAQVLSGREVYGGFLAKAALSVAVDAEQAGDRIAQLIMDKNLRAAMAAKARARAEAVYDWKKIIPQYETMWDEMGKRRAAMRENFSLRPPLPSPSRRGEGNSFLWPILPDPYFMYEAFPSGVLKDGDRVEVVASAERMAMLWRHEMNVYGYDIMLAPADIMAVLEWLGSGGERTIGELRAQFSGLDNARLWRTLAWLQKLGIIRNTPCQAVAGG